MQKLLIVSCTVVLTVLAIAHHAPASSTRGKTYSLRSGRAKGAVDLVQAALEVGGDLKMIQEGKVQRMKMSVAAKFVYEERALHAPSAHGPMRSVRYYHQAAGTIRSGDYQYKPVLRDLRRLIGVEIDGPQVTLFSPQGTLTFEELDLIDVLANSLLLDRLLPRKPVAVRSQWQHPDDLIAAMLGLDTISKSDVKSVLSGVADGKASVEISGRVAGAENGVSTRLELKGKYQFDLKTKRISWFGLLVREDRSLGHVDTGFDVVARLQMKITPGRQSEHLTDAALANLPLTPTPELTALSYEPAGGKWRLRHDRRWFVISDEEDQAVLRLVDGGHKLAQCSIALLPEADDAGQFTLEEFQRDVIRGLGENFRNLVRASQRHNEADYRVFQVVAEGEASNVPVQWVYYLVTDKYGCRVVLAFVLQKDLLDRFEQADERLLSTLRLAEPKIASRPEDDQPSDGEKR